MSIDESRRRSRWILRVMEWDDARARYPNLWHQGLPRHVLAFETVANRLRLGDLIALYGPESQKHPERSERFVGIARVAGLRRADDPEHAWVDLEPAHRFDPPLDLGEAPRRVFLCCDPGWPAREVELFQRVFDTAVARGWQPRSEEREAPVSREHPPEMPSAPIDVQDSEQGSGAPKTVAPDEEVRTAGTETSAARFEGTPRLFGGADYSGDMRDPREGTWLALVAMLGGEAVRVIRLEATGRVGLHDHLRNPDTELLRAEAFGFDFPFGLPLPFAEAILGGPFPEEGWWALARRIERMSRPEYLIALQDFRDAHGETKRLSDEIAGAFSPLHRVNPDLGPMTFHGIRMIAEERSRYAVRPFESARGRLLLEVYPGGSLRKLGFRFQGVGGAEKPAAILSALQRAPRFPLEIGEPFRRRCLERRDALYAVLAARCAAIAVASGEAERSPEELAPGQADRVRREGWIYGLADV